MTNRLEALILKLDESRRIIASQLVEKKWFKSSLHTIQETILNLPKEFDGMIKELSSRQDKIGNVEVLSLLKVDLAKSYAILRFKTRSVATNELLEQEFICHMSGNNPNCRGLILVEIGGEIKFLILRNVIDFATGTKMVGSITTYYPQFSNNNLVTLPSKIESQLKKLLRLESIRIKRFIDLSGVYTDSLMTNNFTSLFAIIIQVEKLVETDRTNDLEVVGIGSLSTLIDKTNDSYLLAIISRLTNLDIISLKKYE